MLRILGNHRHGGSLTRRSFLQVGSLGVAGLTLPDLLRWQSQAKENHRPIRDTAVILIWLDGGPSHLDTYDFKPDAPAEFRGPFQPIRTSVPGIDVCDLLPTQAKIMHRVAVVRSFCHTTLDHYAGQNWLLTGHQGPNVTRQEPVYPSVGAITAKLRGPNRPGLPAFVGVPTVSTTFMPPPGYFAGGFLGSAYNPFQTTNDPNSPDFSVPNLNLDISLERLAERRTLLQNLDTVRRELDHSGTAASLDQFQHEAYQMITNPAAARAFDIAKEPTRLRDRYGRHTIGQSCLLARRLVEAGVTFVTVHAGNWDNHTILGTRRMQTMLPEFDLALSALIEDLGERGLYDRVVVCAAGEFGRTPRVNANGGRDHWCNAGIVLFGGGGLRIGQAIGSTTARGEQVKDNPVGPTDVLATLYRVLGIDPGITLSDRMGRPVPLLPSGQPIKELF